MHPDEITGATLELSVAIHKELGPGLLESIYEAILAYELRKHGFRVRRQQHVRFIYDGVVFEEAYRSDLIVEDIVVVEVKSATKIDPGNARQLLSYLRLIDMRLGLIINFGQPTLRAGVKRLVNKLPSFANSRVLINRPIPTRSSQKQENDPRHASGASQVSAPPASPAPPA